MNIFKRFRKPRIKASSSFPDDDRAYPCQAEQPPDLTKADLKGAWAQLKRGNEPCYDCGAALGEPRYINVRRQDNRRLGQIRTFTMSQRSYCGRCVPAYDLVETRELRSTLTNEFFPIPERYFVTVHGAVEVDAAGKPIISKEDILCQLLPTKFPRSTGPSPVRRSTRKPSARSRSRSRSRG